MTYMILKNSDKKNAAIDLGSWNSNNKDCWDRLWDLNEDFFGLIDTTDLEEVVDDFYGRDIPVIDTYEGLVEFFSTGAY